MPSASMVLLLVEDDAQKVLIRRYLVANGFGGHQIRALPMASGRGAGEQWVRKQYPQVVKEYRSRTTKAVTILIVAIDADISSVAGRARLLADSLTIEGLNPRGESEKISHLIPKRNIETWILCLTGSEVDEANDYRRDTRISAELLKPAAVKLLEWSRDVSGRPLNAVPSIITAMGELKRIG